AIFQLGFPFLPPARAKAARHNHANEGDQALRQRSKTLSVVIWHITATFLKHAAVLPLSARRFRLLRDGEEALQGAIPFERISERRVSSFSQFVITTRRTLLALGDFVRFPTRRDYPRLLEPAQGRIDRAARQPRHVNNIEAVLIAARQRLQDDGSRVTELDFVAHR